MTDQHQSLVVQDSAQTRLRRTSPAQVAWLRRELPAWQRDGLVTSEAAAAILAQYESVRRITIGALVTTLGAIFVGIGLIWTVAANLDAMSPIVRFVLAVAIWLALTASAWVVGEHRAVAGDVASPLVGALRGLSAASYGAVVFQAAQSLQVPAYSSSLVLVWALGALLYAYVVRGLAPMTLGIGLLAVWVVWTAVDSGGSATEAAVALLGAGAIGVGLGQLHAWRGYSDFASVWRVAGTVLGLGGLFVAALPFAWEQGPPSAAIWALAAVTAAVVLGAGFTVRAGLDLFELLLAALTAVAGIVLAYWRPHPSDIVDLSSPPGWLYARAVVAVVIFLGVTAGIVVIGSLRGLSALTVVATAALVIFVTVQASSAFATILSGAVLFLLVGLVLIGTGILAERGRRRLTSLAKDHEEELS